MAESWNPVPLAKFDAILSGEPLSREDRALFDFARLVGIGMAGSYSLRTLAARWGFAGVRPARKVIDVVTNPENGWCVMKGQSFEYAQRLRVLFGVEDARKTQQGRSRDAAGTQLEHSTASGRDAVEPVIPPQSAPEGRTKDAAGTQSDHPSCVIACDASARVSSSPSDRIGSERNETEQEHQEQEQPPTPCEGDTAIAVQVLESPVNLPLFTDDVNRIADQQAAALREQAPSAAVPPPQPASGRQASSPTNSRARKGGKGESDGPVIETATKPDIPERFKSCALAKALAKLWYGTECALKDGTNAEVFGALGDAALAWIEASGQAFVMDRYGYNTVRGTFLTWLEQGQDPARLIDVAAAPPTDDDMKGGWYTFVNRFRSIDSVQRTLSRQQPGRQGTGFNLANRYVDRYGGAQSTLSGEETEAWMKAEGIR